MAKKWINGNFIRPNEEKENAAIKQIHRYLIGHGRALSSVIGPETTFSFDIDGHTILGKIDLMKRYPGDSIERVDFRTSKMPELGKDIRKKNELDLYALGAEEALGLKVANTTAHAAAYRIFSPQFLQYLEIGSSAQTSLYLTRSLSCR